MMESLEERIRRVTSEEVSVESYNPQWPVLFQHERLHLLACLPQRLIQRIEHFGSTAVPGLSAKPIIDILIGVTSLEETKTQIVPVLEAQGYEYFWRPTYGDDGPPWYAWFIKRDAHTGKRVCHIHMVESHMGEHWDRLLFRDYLIGHADAAAQYQTLKVALAGRYAHDRIRYTEEKSAFIRRITDLAKQRP
jgi:GrpB-like predicted nucleotidyltransferase (UPF0157 family)